MSGTTYPNLGFDPTPGMPEMVESLHAKIKSTVDSMGEANRLMGRLRNSDDSVWQGDAGNAFREHFDSALCGELDHAHQSLGKAVGVLQSWHTNLIHFKDTANKLESEAADARQEQKQADTALQQAKSNPDLKLTGEIFTDSDALRQANAKIGAAESAVSNAKAKAEGAADKLKDIIRRAQELQDRHEDTARKAAKALKDATVNLAPEQGLLSKLADAFNSAVNSVGDWVKAHLKDIHAVLSTVSAVGGLLALVTPPPFDLIALGVSVAAGAGSLAVDAADPKFRHGIGELMHGNFNKDSMGAAMTGVGDAAAVIPGATVGAKAGVGAVKGTNATLESASGATGVAAIAEGVAHQPGFVVNQLHKVPGASKIGEAATFGDKLLNKAIPEAAHNGREINSLDRLTLLWRGKTAGSTVQHDVKDATS